MGQPSAEDLGGLAERGVLRVINFRTPPEVAGIGFDEKAMVEDLKAEYIHTPIGREAPTNETLERIFDFRGAQIGPLLANYNPTEVVS